LNFLKCYEKYSFKRISIKTSFITNISFSASIFNSKSFLGSLWCLWGFTWGCWGLACRSLSKNFTTWWGLSTLLFLVPVEVFLELGHGHLISGLGGFLSTWRWVGWDLGLGTSCGFLCRWLASSWGRLTLLWGLFSAWWLVWSVFNNLINALSDISGLTSSSLLGNSLLGSWLWGSLLLSLGTSSNLWLDLDLLVLSILNSLKSILALLLDENVLDSYNGGVTLLECEVCELVTLWGTSLDNTSIDLGLLACCFSSWDLWDIWKWLLFSVLGNG